MENRLAWAAGGVERAAWKHAHFVCKVWSRGDCAGDAGHSSLVLCDDLGGGGEGGGGRLRREGICVTYADSC